MNMKSAVNATLTDALQTNLDYLFVSTYSAERCCTYESCYASFNQVSTVINWLRVETWFRELQQKCGICETNFCVLGTSNYWFFHPSEQPKISKPTFGWIKLADGNFYIQSNVDELLGAVIIVWDFHSWKNNKYCLDTELIWQNLVIS